MFFLKNIGRLAVAKRGIEWYGNRRKNRWEQKMEETGIRKEVIEEIRNFARKYQVKKVILFGSRARGDYKRTSDIDIAVSGGDFAEFALDVEEETSTLLEFDIVNLDREMQDELREAIEREGKILYEKV